MKYEGYIKRQHAEIKRTEKAHSMKICNIDYSCVTGLRLEAREKLMKIRPETLGQASRIGGVNPADIAVLRIYGEKLKVRLPDVRGVRK